MAAKDHDAADTSHGVDEDVYEPSLGYEPFGALSAVVNIDKPIASSIELVGVNRLVPVPVLAPGATSPPAFDLLVRIHNDHILDRHREGGSVEFSYAGVPLAPYGSIPSFRLGPRKTLTVAVNATREAAGVPEDLIRFMARGGANDGRAEIVMQLGWPGLEFVLLDCGFIIWMDRKLCEFRT